MITFRLSEQEYERFRELCFVRGIRSVSEMARMAINMLSEKPVETPKEALEMRVSDLEARLHLLAAEVKKLNSQTKRTGFAPTAELQFVATAAE